VSDFFVKNDSFVYEIGTSTGEFIFKLSEHNKNKPKVKYLRKNAIELIMIKHGWKPFITTEDPICGDTRAGNGYCIGRTCDIPEKNELLSIIENGQRVDPKDIISELDGIDEKLLNNKRKRLQK
jgi:adenylosuccinate synthase